MSFWKCLTKDQRLLAQQPYANLRRKKTEEEFEELMLQVPNIPDPTVPEGKSEEDNVEIRRWAPTPEGRGPDWNVGRDKIPIFSFKIKDHFTLMQKLGLADTERGAKVSGFRGYFLKNDGALLSFALWRFALDYMLQKGFTPFIAPALVKENIFVKTGKLPQFREDIYATEDGLFLAPSAEVPMMGYHEGEILSEDELPKKYAAFSPCYRREAGSYGKDTKGLIRVHEFFKFEQVILCEASHDESVKYHEELNRNTEEFIESLKIPYRTVINCGGDLGLGQVKKYDIELWVPLENTYREIASASYFHDFQTRRLNIRYKDGDEKPKYAHSLNNTAIATPRILVSLVENFQQADGSIKIPEVLVPYMNGLAEIKNK